MKMNLFCFYVVKNALFFWNSPPPRSRQKEENGKEKKRRNNRFAFARARERTIRIIDND
jgi:hypothetical protein